MDKEIDRRMRELAEGQHAHVSRAQARLLGASRAQLRRRIAAGEWEEATPQVLRRTGAPVTVRGRWMAAVLHAGPDAVLVRGAAADLYGLPGFGGARVETTVPRHGTNRETGRTSAHEPLLLPAHHVTVIDGIPVTRLARTLFDLAGCLHPLRAERAMSNALGRKLVKLEQLHAIGLELCKTGRPGSAMVRAFLSRRGVDTAFPESELEAMFLSILAEAALPLPALQVDLGGDDGWIGRVDGYYREHKLDVEIDGDLGHVDELDTRADQRRDAAMRRAGFEVIRISEDEVRHQRDIVLAKVTGALDATRAETRRQSA